MRNRGTRFLFLKGNLLTTHITRRLEFDAGHRVLGHEGKCANLHGHRYRAEITVSSEQLDSISRVIDFGVVKQILGTWIDDNWDHNILLHNEDPLLQQESVFGGKPPFIIPGGENPTAEILAKLLYREAESRLPLTVEKVRIYETPNCWADFSESSCR